MLKRTILPLFLLIALLVVPSLCLADVAAYSIQNNIGTAPQTVMVTVETTAQVRGLKIVDGSNRSIPCSISQSENGGNKLWTLTALVDTACTDEWTVYLKTSDGNWNMSDICFFVDISGGSAAAASTPRPTATPRPQWSTGSFSYAWAVPTKGYDERINSHSGPANSFMDSGSYKVYKITGLSALFEEKYSGVTWVYGEMTYQNGYKRRVYFKNNQLDWGSVPFVTFSRTPAYLNRQIVPTYGPAPDYDDFEDERYKIVTLNANTDVSILHEENGYFFIEFVYSGKDCRAWVPVSAVSVY